MDLDFLVTLPHPDESDTRNRGRLGTQTEADLKVWKGGVIEVLKDSRSEGRKFLRWRVYERRRYHAISMNILAEEGELEVLPKTSP